MDNSGASPASVLRFGVFELDCQAGELRKSGRLIHLPPQPCKILALLASHPGQVITREDIRRQIWGDETFVDFEQGLNHCIRQIRTALGDDAESPRYIKTLPRRGYRFIAPLDGGSVPSPARETVDAGRRQHTLRTAATSTAIVATILAVLFGFNVAGIRKRVMQAVTTPRQPVQIHSIAVLPLANLSGDPTQNYFADGMTDELITTLDTISALRVISRTSVMRFKGTREPLPLIAKELNVDAIVEGSVLRSGDRVRITAQLIQASPEKALWAQTYERDLRDVLALQSNVAQAIASEVQVKLTAQEQRRVASTRPVNPESYRLYLQGRYILNQRTPAGTEKSISLFQQALEKDPDNALAWAGLSQSYAAVAVRYSTSPQRWFLKAKAAALKALEIDNSLAEAHTSLGWIHLRWDWDWPAAGREFKYAVDLKPGSASARSWYSAYLLTMGRFKQAIAETTRAEEIDPLSTSVLADGIDIYLFARRYDEAVEQARKALALDPNFATGHFMLGLTYILKRMPKEATTELETAARLGKPHTPDMDALIYATAGRRDEARKLLNRVRDLAKRREMTPFAVAQFYVGLGDKEEALDWLERAYDQHDPFMITLKVNPYFDPIRSDPHFEALLRRMNFPP